MSLSTSKLLVCGDISASHVLFKPLRGKYAKETYRFCKGVVLTREVVKPALFCGKQFVAEASSGYIQSMASAGLNYCTGYLCGVGLVRTIYKASNPGFIKNVTRTTYNVLCLPATLYYKGTSSVTDLIGLNRLEKVWFGEEIYIFSDNRVWIEKNFTLDNALYTLNNQLES